MTRNLVENSDVENSDEANMQASSAVTAWQVIKLFPSIVSLMQNQNSSAAMN